MKAIVDSRNVNSLRHVWGLTITERNCHILSECGVSEIVVLTTDGKVTWKHRRLTQRARITVVADPRPLSDIIQDNTTAELVVIDGGIVYDKRAILRICNEPATGLIVGDSDDSGALKLRSQDAPALLSLSYKNLCDLIRQKSSLARWTLDSIDPYVPALRHRVRPHLIPVVNDDTRRLAETTLFQLSYKGGLDFIYQFIYRHIVKVMIRILSKTRITPNHVTLAYLAVAVVAMPVLASGHIGAGLLICLAAMIGDAADGVLARITFQTSKLGHRLDKHSHRIYHSLWYVCAGYGLANGDLQSVVFLNSLVLVALYLVSRMITGKYKDRFHISIFDITPYDRMFRYISGARWNINMLILGLGVIFNHEKEAFLLMTGWGLVALVVWTTRHFTSGETA